jgi:putative FmdB family regulatory protein
MPIYEYRCGECESRFEKLVRSAGDEPAGLACPHCGSDDVRRLISRVAVSSGQGDEAGSPSTSPPVFGRKELKQAIEDRGY